MTDVEFIFRLSILVLIICVFGPTLVYVCVKMARMGYLMGTRRFQQLQEEWERNANQTREESQAEG